MADLDTRSGVEAPARNSKSGGSSGEAGSRLYHGGDDGSGGDRVPIAVIDYV